MNPWIHVAGWTLVHFVWQGGLIGLAAALALRFLRDALPDARYVVACTALATMLASPVITATFLPAAVPNASSTPFGLSPSAFSRDAAAAPMVSREVAGPDHDTSATQAFQFDVDPFLRFVVVLWLIGVVFLLVRLAGGWRHVRRLRRASLATFATGASRWYEAAERIALRIGLHGGVCVVDSLLVETPTLVGWLRPIILLPIAALANLTPGQVDAILAHELAHVRRHDYLVNLLQMVAETLVFYHPAVWWLSARVRAEREQCCDEMAVEVCGDPVGYAAALAELEAWRTEQAALTLAATGGSLLERVRRVLRGPTDSRRPASRTMPATMTTALVLMSIVGFGALQQLPASGAYGAGGKGTIAPVRSSVSNSAQFRVQLLSAPPPLPLSPPIVSVLVSRHGHDPRQTPPADAAIPRFDIVSVRRHQSDDRSRGLVFQSPSGPLTATNFSVRELLRFAYQLPDARIIGAPSWFDAERFDIVARSVSPIPSAIGIEGDPTADQIPAILQKLVAQTFKLTSHKEKGEFPGYALGLARPDGALGPHLRRSTVDCIAAAREAAPGRLPCGWWETGPSSVAVRGVTMAQVAARTMGILLPKDDLRDVVDRTGLAGTFDLEVEGFRPIRIAGWIIGRDYPAVAAMLGLPSVFRDFEEQLGLKLEPAKVPGDVLIVDSATRPAEN